MIKGIAVIKYIANKSSCKNFGNSQRHIRANTTKVTNMIKAATTSLRNMLSKILIIDVGKKHSSLTRCFCVPIIRNSVLFAFSFNLLLVIQWNTFWIQSLSWLKDFFYIRSSQGKV